MTKEKELELAAQADSASRMLGVVAGALMKSLVDKASEAAATGMDRKELCNEILVVLAGLKYPTPEETYGEDVGWAVRDLATAAEQAKEHSNAVKAELSRAQDQARSGANALAAVLDLHLYLDEAGVPGSKDVGIRKRLLDWLEARPLPLAELKYGDELECTKDYRYGEAKDRLVARGHRYKFAGSGASVPYGTAWNTIEDGYWKATVQGAYVVVSVEKATGTSITEFVPATHLKLAPKGGAA